MKKKIALVLSIMLIGIFAGGCWNYRSLSDMTIVTALAIDLGKEGGYDLTFETIDMSGPVKQEGIKSLLIESHGATLFDAARNAKRRNISRLYFGHMQAVIISEDVARSCDIGSLIDWFLRDAELRETIYIIISAGNAREFISAKPYGTSLIGAELHQTMDEDKKTTLSVSYEELYSIYNTINGEGESLTLPAFHVTDNGGEVTIESYGAAVFKEQRMVGMLSPDETKYYMYIQDEAEGGLLTFPASGEGPDDTSLEVSKNSTDRSFSYENGKLKIRIETNTDVFLAEYKQPAGEMNKEKIQALESAAASFVARRIGNVIKKVQAEYASDIFGFGSMIYRQDPALWEQLKANWNDTFASLEVDIECTINIVNTASMKE